MTSLRVISYADSWCLTGRQPPKNCFHLDRISASSWDFIDHQNKFCHRVQSRHVLVRT